MLYFLISFIFLALALSAGTPAQAADGVTTSLGGHSKLQFTAGFYPRDSVFRDLLGDHAVDASVETRAGGARAARAG